MRVSAHLATLRLHQIVPQTRSHLLCLLACVLAGCGRDSTNGPAEPPAAALVLSGRVVARDNAVSGARVRFKGHDAFVTTDDQGRFQLPRPATIADDAVITAAKPGYIIAGVPVADSQELELTPLPDHDDPNYRWVDPTPDASSPHNCGNCHREIYDQWHASGHARAANNSRLLDLYGSFQSSDPNADGWSLLAEYPEGAGVCIACHAPAAPEDALATGDLRSLVGTARHGVHCDYCHKIQDVELSALGLTHGRFGTRLLRPTTGQLFFGPLDDVDRDEDSYLPLQSQSEICANCHEGILFGVPVYTTYSEWLASPARAAGKQCQTCHLQPNGVLTNIAPGAGGLERNPTTLASHQLLPGERTAMLRRCLDLRVDTQRRQDGVAVQVHLEARDVGHRVPTGFVDRHLLLVIEPQSAQGKSLEPLRGPRLPPAAGDLADRPGTLFAKLLRDPEGNCPVPFWRAGVTVDDNRLQPHVRHTEEFLLPPDVAQVRVQLLFRPFWQPTAIAKHWPDETVEVLEQVVETR